MKNLFLIFCILISALFICNCNRRLIQQHKHQPAYTILKTSDSIVNYLWNKKSQEAGISTEKRVLLDSITTLKNEMSTYIINAEENGDNISSDLLLDTLNEKSQIFNDLVNEFIK
jgi:hypothetical protein